MSGILKINWITSCKKNPTPPVVTTTTVTGTTQTTATTGGNVTSDGNATVSSRGVCWNTSENPTVANNKTSDGSGTGAFTSSITQLTSGTNYFVRAYATNSEGTSYGSQVSFSTNPVLLSTLTTAAVTSITYTTAVSGGNITDDGGGSVTARGVCWATTANPTVSNNKTADGSGTGSFTSNLTGLSAGTTYYIRAYATNSAGTAYGNELSFLSLQIKDADDNVYSTVTIGSQVWMVENLKTTKYNDNSAIPNILENDTWTNSTTPGYCWYDNDASSYKATYGALYNWYAVNTGKLCPAGWHVPSSAEWTTLVVSVGGENVAGGKMKEAGIIHWENPNNGASNLSGFTALPGGYRPGFFDWIRYHGLWWSSTEWDITSAWYLGINDDSPYSYQPYIDKFEGLSVRCLKD